MHSSDALSLYRIRFQRVSHLTPGGVSLKFINVRFLAEVFRRRSVLKHSLYCRSFQWQRCDDPVIPRNGAFSHAGPRQFNEISFQSLRRRHLNIQITNLLRSQERKDSRFLKSCETARKSAIFTFNYSIP